MFARRLRRARTAQRLTQTTIAQAMGCAQPFYQRVETGRVLPSLRNFARLRGYLAFDANPMLEALNEVAPPRPSGPYARLGVFIAHVRTQAEKTVIAVARAVGCSTQDYERLEVGARLPTVAELVRLHRLLDFNANTALRWIPLEHLPPMDRDG